MSAETQWFVMQGEEQLGPYSGELLVQYATGGNITRESLVWAEGMAEWLPAGQIEGVFPPEAAPLQAVAVATAQPGRMVLGGAAPAYGANPYGANPYAPPGMHPAIGADDPYPSPGVKAASYGLWIGLVLGGIVLMIIGIVLMSAVGASAANSASPDAELSNAQAGGLGAGFLVLMIGALLNALSMIPMLMTLHRAWQCLQAGGLARSTPGKAVGFLFIPFYNYYWLFMAFHGLAKDWNRTVTSYSDLKSAPKMSEGVFLTYCIGCFLPPLGPIMLFPVMAQMCKGINFFAYRPRTGQAGILGGGGGGATGGLNLGGGFTIR
jgi:hypothetical protein